MAEIIEALFTAEEQISEALQKASKATDGFQEDVSELSVNLTNLGIKVDENEEEFDQLAGDLVKVGENVKSVDRNIGELSSQFIELQNAESVSKDELREFNRRLTDAAIDSAEADEAIGQLRNNMTELAANSNLSKEQVDQLKDQIDRLGDRTTGASTQITQLMSASSGLRQMLDRLDESTEDVSETFAGFGFVTAGALRPINRAEHAVDGVSTSMTQLNGAALSATPAINILDNRLNSMGESAEDAAQESATLAGSLGLLNAVASSAALEFGSLSVNIGPFNLALRNIITQLPAILTGMTTMLAIVGSLIAAFATLAVVTGALVLGGALAFFEEFSAQFEETGEAIEALGAALRDLFVAALEPIINQTNMDLFISTINAAADVVNEFAQFVTQMRGDVMSFVGSVDVDLAAAFEAMHDSFALMRPVLREFIEFFVNEMPPIITRFAELTANISGDISTLITVFGALINELVEFASVILAGLAPVISAVVGILIGFFKVLNLLPESLVAAGITALGFSLVLLKLISSVVGATAAIINLNARMVENAAAGTFLGGVYTQLTGITKAYTAGNISLLQALSLVKASIWREVLALKADIVAKLSDTLATKALITAKNGLIAITLGVIGALLGETAASWAATAGMTAYGIATSIAAGATSILVGAIGTLLSPVGALIVVLAVLVGWLLKIAGIDIFGGIADAVSFVVDKVSQLIDGLKEFIGLTGFFNVGAQDGVASVDDIQTDPSVDLSFEESLEQNVDVQADPDDRAGLKRITKDAIEEANSFSRRQQGGQ